MRYLPHGSLYVKRTDTARPSSFNLLDSTIINFITSRMLRDMALRLGKRSINSSLEKRTFADWFAHLRTAVEPEVDELTANLYSARLIGRETRDNDTGTKAKKADRVLRCVESSIDRKPEIFHHFVSILDNFPSLSDIASSLRENTAVVAPQHVENTSGGRSRLCVATHAQAPPTADQDETVRMDHKLAELQLTSSSHARQDSESYQEAEPFKAKGTMASEMLPGVRYVAGNRQETHLSTAAAFRHAQDVPSVSLAVTDEHGALRPFHNLSDTDLLTRKHFPVSTLLSTREERAPVQDRLSHPAHYFNYDVTSSLCRSESSSSSGSDNGEFEDSQTNRYIEQGKGMWDLCQRTEREKFKLEKRLKQKEKENFRLRKELKLTQEEASENIRCCNMLSQKHDLLETQIQSLKEQCTSLQRENQQCHRQRTEYEQKIELLERQIDYLLDGQKKLLRHQEDNTQDPVQTPDSTNH